jgi:hypothetical protein
MAESFSEEWVLLWFSWGDNWGVGSLSPLATIVASSSSIRSEASLNEFSIFGEVHWSAEFITWDEFFTIRPVATWSSSAESCSVSLGAAFPNRFFGVLRNLNWMAEVNREQWDFVVWLNLSLSPMACCLKGSASIFSLDSLAAISGSWNSSNSGTIVCINNSISFPDAVRFVTDSLNCRFSAHFLESNGVSRRKWVALSLGKFSISLEPLAS